MSIDKQRFPLALAESVARGLIENLEESCQKIMLVGSVRRRKPDVGDIEFIIIRKVSERDSKDLFPIKEKYSETDDALDVMVSHGFLEFRETKIGSLVNGEKIKLLRHVESGIPVDIFITSEDSWFNYMVCRTGPAKSNIRIAERAKMKGMKWEPYSDGFLIKASGERIVCRSEADVFKAVDLFYKLPEHR